MTDAPGSPTPADRPVSPPGEDGQLTRSIGAMRDQLAQATSTVQSASAVRATELEIGQLLVEAQRFTETALAEFQEQARQTLAEAEAEGAAIIADARREADRLVAEARASSPVPPETARVLQSLIAGFVQINHELLRELEILDGVLSPLTEEPADQPELAGSSDTAGTAQLTETAESDAG